MHLIAAPRLIGYVCTGIRVGEQRMQALALPHVEVKGVLIVAAVIDAWFAGITYPLPRFDDQRHFLVVLRP